MLVKKYLVYSCLHLLNLQSTEYKHKKFGPARVDIQPSQSQDPTPEAAAATTTATATATATPPHSATPDLSQAQPQFQTNQRPKSPQIPFSFGNSVGSNLHQSRYVRNPNGTSATIIRPQPRRATAQPPQKRFTVSF